MWDREDIVPVRVPPGFPRVASIRTEEAYQKDQEISSERMSGLCLKDDVISVVYNASAFLFDGYGHMKAL
jgi:hypothetical protein